MKKNSKVTIKDVAKYAGVGIGTVSRAINGSNQISAETKKKIFDCIEQLGYSPDPLAQSMRTKKYKHIAFIVNISNIAFAQIANGIYNYLDDMGYTLSLCNTGDKNISEKVLSFMDGRKFDGIIIAPPREDDKELQQLILKLDVPIITLDRQIPGLPAGIITDYYTSVKKATQYLLSFGHRGIALIGGPRNLHPGRMRGEGFREAFAESGITCPDELILEGDFTSKFGRKAMIDLLPRINEGSITAILCLNHYIFHGILQVMRDNSLEYPDDVSLITFEDHELTQLLKPAVTVIRRPLFNMGYSVAQILVRYIESPELYGKLDPVVIPTEFIIRESCKAIK